MHEFTLKVIEEANKGRLWILQKGVVKVNLIMNSAHQSGIYSKMAYKIFKDGVGKGAVHYEGHCMGSELMPASS